MNSINPKEKVGHWPQQYGAALIKEHPQWSSKFPLGPVHWDVWLLSGQPLQEAVPTNELPKLLVQKGLLRQW